MTARRSPNRAELRYEDLPTPERLTVEATLYGGGIPDSGLPDYGRRDRAALRRRIALALEPYDPLQDDTRDEEQEAIEAARTRAGRAWHRARSLYHASRRRLRSMTEPARRRIRTTRASWDADDRIWSNAGKRRWDPDDRVWYCPGAYEADDDGHHVEPPRVSLALRLIDCLRRTRTLKETDYRYRGYLLSDWRPQGWILISRAIRTTIDPDEPGTAWRQTSDDRMRYEDPLTRRHHAEHGGMRLLVVARPDPEPSTWRVADSNFAPTDIKAGGTAPTAAEARKAALDAARSFHTASMT